MKSFIKYSFYSLVGALLTAPIVASAQGLKNAQGFLNKAGANAGTGDATVESIVGGAINTALSLVGLIFLVLMVYAGYLWMTARGEESQIDKAKSIIRSAIIGIVVVMSAYAITFLVTTRLESAG